MPSIYEIGSATGTSTLTLMGTVILQTMDDEGEKHLFALNKVNYLPNSPVNLRSFHQRAKLYPYSSGYPDKNGSGIRSGFDSTPCSGLKRNSKRLFGPQPWDFLNAYSTQDIQDWNYS